MMGTTNRHSFADDKSDLDQAVLAVFATEDLLLPDGKIDNTKFHARCFATVKDHKVLNRGELNTHAITRGTLVEGVFPNLPGLDALDTQDEPEFAKRVLAEVTKRVWAAVHPDAGKPVQTLVAHVLGNGYVLCRTKIGADGTDAVYITDNRALINTDFIGPENLTVVRKVRKVANNREMLISRQPENAKHYERNANATLRQISLELKQRLAIAVDAVLNPQNEDDEPEESESDEADES